MDQSVLQNLLFQASIWVIPILIAITLHEAAHGYVAAMCGDPTARLMGRVTLNPLPHIDKFGTIVLPILCLISQLGLVFGYAKPVPVNFSRFRNPRRDMILVAAAGPLSNVLLLVASALLFHVAGWFPDWFGHWFLETLQCSVIINAILAVFNMVPVPPLDGGRIVTGLLPYSLAVRYARLERYGMVIVIGVFFVLPSIAGVVNHDLELFRAVLVVPIYSLIDAVFTIVGLR